jgi:hypothetical protein
MEPRSDQPLILKENSEWLRYVLWGGAIGMCFIAASTIASPEREAGKIVGAALGVLLLGFAGCVMQTRRAVIDPARREVTLVTKGLRRQSVERLAFADIRRIRLLATSERDEGVDRSRWAIVLVLDQRSVQLTRNLYLTRDQAMRDAAAIQQRLGVEISAGPKRTGRT